MRYHYEKPELYIPIYGETYKCNHPVYSKCTLFKIEDRGLSIIQQRYNPDNKSTWWSELDPWLPNVLFLNKGFKSFYDLRSGTCKDGLYPTVTIRQIMWALKIKPIKRERWETVFDRKDI